ncbi:hypothetical protein CSW29_11970 [Thermus scotoductus]|uniref:Uncharacterized protein n=1 Tax=Thermus scotoductus TaxID=37636 RepID=A0A430R882_THESC|nr:hypothetical protein [Thermus scotoductus]RTH03650.1 hypothetical protein CSW47_08105 [Thermus scotoductus]RTH97135.1 hypothetical protein CSW29_11970 [Thermus scotoductus]
MRELHWALVPVLIPLGSAVIRWTLGFTLVALVYYTWAGNPGLSELPGIAIFAYTAFLTGHLYETLEIYLKKPWQRVQEASYFPKGISCGVGRRVRVLVDGAHRLGLKPLYRGMWTRSGKRPIAVAHTWS